LAYILIGLIAFVSETIDSSLGGGYGTILTPILLFMGYEPLQVVPLILFSEILTGLGAGISHHAVGNVNLKPGSKGFRIGLTLGLCGIIGSIVAVHCAFSLPKTVVKGYIAFLIIFLGLFNLLSLEMSFKFSWKKILGLGFLASFNKGLSGGGYGPLIVGGQLLSGLPPRKAVGITSFAEGITCIIGLVTYFLYNGTTLALDWYLGLALTAGAVLSVPFSVNLVRILPERFLRKAIACTIFILGLATFFNTFSHLLVPANVPLVIACLLVATPIGYFIGRKVQRAKQDVAE